MSQKISGKNLHYDTTLPPFLARLRGQAAAANDGPDPQLVRNRRHAKPRSGSAEAEDAPLVVDDEGNVVQGMRVGADGAVTAEMDTDKPADGGEGGEQAGDKLAADKDREDLKERERVAGIGAGKKRKVGKVVGADDGEAGQTEGRAGARKAGDGEGKAAPPAKKKKAKKIKLSFGDDDG
ncbi:hypothetical protein CONLIGDRAFT_213707 [Coniochaeta ligniaria NRRL 30616]|uniref:DUF4604 domain-containing protein n=1 Tax=Coniochaeta ligniaria NRRL 30616 TaxID=1408157 RepID=A0A1J7J414_9PEZI|nr:hypothetical protein CONLIGDRAFT_213707 [Coniochaeta ligniaria NRRL 30616]